MKKNESFNSLIKSSTPPEDLRFRLVTRGDREAVSKLMSERNPNQDKIEILQKTEKEISLTKSDPEYRLFVADLNGQVLGLCRYFHSKGLPKEKLLYPAPEGWYCMGILVDPQFRRQGIARFLFQNRLISLKENGAKIIYSVVDVDNLTSIKMHQDFGFEELERAQGFLNIKFDSSGVLYRMCVS